MERRVFSQVNDQLRTPAVHWGGCAARQPEVTQMRTKNGVTLSDAETQAIVRYLWAAATAS